MKDIIQKVGRQPRLHVTQTKSQAYASADPMYKVSFINCLPICLLITFVGAIAGIVVALLIFILLAVLLSLFIFCRICRSVFWMDQPLQVKVFD